MAATAVTYDIAGHASRAVRFVNDLVFALERHHARQKTRRILETLTDHQLSDIGVTRLDVHLMH